MPSAADHPLDILQPQVRDCYWSLHPATEVGRQSPRCLSAGALTGDHNRIGPLQGSESFSPGTCGQGPTNGTGSLGAHHRDVEIAVDVQPLVGVVQNQDLRSSGQRPLRTGRPVGIGNDSSFRDRVLVHQDLVRAVAPQQDPRDQASGDVVPCGPDASAWHRGGDWSTATELCDGYRRVVPCASARDLVQPGNCPADTLIESGVSGLHLKRLSIGDPHVREGFRNRESVPGM
jgi:hypothetical protein